MLKYKKFYAGKQDNVFYGSWRLYCHCTVCCIYDAQVKILSIANNLTFKAILTTVGRNTGKEHSVWAKAVTYNNMIYFSRRNPNSDWLKNAIANPRVKVKFDGKEFSGNARLVKDEELSRKISSIKYIEKNRQEEPRIVLEVELSSA